MQSKESYWNHIEEAFERVSIYDGEEAWLSGLKAYPEYIQELLAAHWTMSEVLNGGLGQYFQNSTGVVAPEAIEGFTRIGQLEVANILKAAMAYFGTEYPRDREIRGKLLGSGEDETEGFSLIPAWVKSKVGASAGKGQKPKKRFEELDDKLFALEEEVWSAMEKYAAKHGEPPARPAEPTRESKKTKADPSASKSELEKMFASMLENLGNEAQSATAEFREHLQKQRLNAPSLTLKLVRVPDADSLKSAEAAQVLRRIGKGAYAGTFTIEKMPQFVTLGFADAQAGAYVSILALGKQIFTSLQSICADGRSREYTNMPTPFEAPQPEWMARRRYPGSSFEELRKKFLEEEPPNWASKVSVEGFAKAVEEEYARYQSWLAERGGLTRGELAQKLKAAGKLPSGDEGEELLNQLRADEIEKALANWWKLQTGTPATIEDIADKLVVIHDEMPVELVVNAYWCGTSDWKAKDSDFVGPPREAFAQVLRDRGAKLKKVLEKTTPLRADFYLPS
jgi:hypothetical protein